MSESKKINLYDVVLSVESFVSWREKDEGTIELIIPRFKTKWTYNMLKRLGRDPDIHVSLEEHGSAVLKLIDGKRTVKEIVDLLDDHFNHEENYEYRVCKFIEMLHQQRIAKYMIPK